MRLFSARSRRKGGICYQVKHLRAALDFDNVLIPAGERHTVFSIYESQTTTFIRKFVEMYPAARLNRDPCPICRGSRGSRLSVTKLFRREGTSVLKRGRVLTIIRGWYRYASRYPVHFSRRSISHSVCSRKGAGRGDAARDRSAGSYARRRGRDTQVPLERRQPVPFSMYN